MEALKFYIHLFSFLHRPVSLHLKLLQNVGCFSDFAVLLLHLGQNVSQTGPLDFNINLFKSERYVDFQDFLEVFEQGEKGPTRLSAHLASCDCPQSVNEFQFQFFGRHLINILAALLDHLGDSCLQLTPPFGQGYDIFVKQIPLLGLKADLDDGLQYPPSGDSVSSLKQSRKSQTV